MTKVQELQTALDEQAAKIEEERQQVVSILEEQTATISELREQVAQGATPEVLQGLIDKVQANTTAMSAIYNPPAEEPEEDPEEPAQPE